MRAINSVCNSEFLDGTWMAEHFEECGGDLELRSFLKQVYTFTSLLSWSLSGVVATLSYILPNCPPTQQKLFQLDWINVAPFTAKNGPNPKTLKIKLNL